MLGLRALAREVFGERKGEHPNSQESSLAYPVRDLFLRPFFLIEVAQCKTGQPPHSHDSFLNSSCSGLLFLHFTFTIIRSERPRS